MNEVIQKTIQIEENKEYVFRNQVDFCIGTGRMGLALTKEYQEQLSLVQKEIGFSHIRGHGLFCDDIGIYQETPEGESEYNFTYLDRVMDSYISLGLRPFFGAWLYAAENGIRNADYLLLEGKHNTASKLQEMD